jgi:predicted Rossmann fold nucleotide-binding protein DprA/Smf involved in DNA uptake
MDPIQGVSAGSPIGERTDDERIGVAFGEQSLAREPGARLLAVMGRRGGWSIDALAEASGLVAREVTVALTLLELGGRVQRRAFAFDPM